MGQLGFQTEKSNILGRNLEKRKKCVNLKGSEKKGREKRNEKQMKGKMNHMLSKRKRDRHK